MKSIKAIAAFAVLTFLALSQPAHAEPLMKDAVLGDANAPVTVIEYASFTCPHCSNFHKTTWPDVKKNYVETGKVKFVFRDFPFERVGMSVAMLARCAGESKYYGFVETFMKLQDSWIKDSNPVEGAMKLAKLGGLSHDDAMTCLENEALLDYILLGRQEAGSKFGIDSTPTFIINGQKVSGALPYDEFSAILDKAAK